MKRTGIALVSTAALLMSYSVFAADASDIAFTYLEGGWTEADGDDFNSTDGFGIAGSLGFGSNFYAQAGYSMLNSDSTDLGYSVDVDTWSIALGYHTRLTTNSEMFFALGWFDSNADFKNSGDLGDTDGFNVESGVRYRASDTMEFGGALVYTNGTVDGGNEGSNYDYNDTSVRIYGQYFIMPAWSVGLRAGLSGSGGGSLASSGDSLTLFTRYSFGDVL
ncbi:MAG: hypothetical protein JNK40_14220 [Chromatiales bacterium]|nr:hypothetical protein [Chromatiales bacterium]